MKRCAHPWFWSAAVFAATVLLLCVCVLHESVWVWLRVSHEHPYFSDLFALLAASDARAAGADPYALPNTFDVFGRPHVYGPWWLELARLGLTRADNGWLGLALGALVLASAAWWLRPRGPKMAAVAFLVLSSPSFLLGLERGNNDLVVLILLLGAAGLMKTGALRRGWWRDAGAAGAVGLAAALKFYPTAALPMLLDRGSARRTLVVVAATVVALGLFVWANQQDLAKAIALVPNQVAGRGFGLSVLPFLWSRIEAGRFWLGLGVLVGLAPWAWLAWRETRWPIPLGWRASGFIAGAATWSACYFVSYGYPYRAVLLLLPAGAWLQVAFAGDRRERTGARAALGLSLLLVWVVVVYGAGPDGTGPVGVRVVYGLLGLQAGLAFGISVYLTWVVTRRSWRALTRWRWPE